MSYPHWKTISITALPTPLAVTVSSCGEMSTELAVALLHQKAQADGERIERIVLGCINQWRGEVEAVEADDGDPAAGGPEVFGVFAGLEWPQSVPQADAAGRNGHGCMDGARAALGPVD